MFSHQMKLISLHPVGPTASFDLSLLHTHQFISLPGDSRLHVPGRKRESGIQQRGSNFIPVLHI